MDTKRKEFQRRLKNLRHGRGVNPGAMMITKRIAKELDAEEILEEAARQGVRVHIKKVIKGDVPNSCTKGVIDILGFKEEKILFEKAELQYYKTRLRELISKVKKDNNYWESTTEYWTRIAEKVGGKEKKGFIEILKIHNKREQQKIAEKERLRKKIYTLAETYKVSIESWGRKDDKIIIWIFFESGLIAETVASKYSEEIKYYSYTPEDMTTPLESFHYISFEDQEKDLEKFFKKIGTMKKEIQAAYEKIKNSTLKQAGLLDQ